MPYPDIVLDSLVILSPPVTTDKFTVLQVDEDLTQSTVNAEVTTGFQKFWVPVLTPENYYSGWDDTDVEAAVKNWATTTFPLSK